MRVWYIFLAIIIFVGCQTYTTPRYTFKSVGTQSNDSENYQGASIYKPLTFKIKYRGFKEIKADEGLHLRVLRFDMKFNNTGAKPIVFQPATYSLIDDESNTFSSDLSYDPEGAELINLRPKSTVKLTLHFPLPPGYQLSEIGSLRLVWNYKLDSQVFRRVSKFVKREIQYYYHDPYYYNYPYYRPRVRFGVGFGYRFGRHCRH